MNEFCIVPVCPNNLAITPGVEYFKVPIGFKRRRWLEAIGRADLLQTGDEVNKTLFICERHFFSHMIYSDKANTKHLQFTAYPLLNLPRSNTYKKKDKNTENECKTTNPKTHVASRLYGVPYVVTEAPHSTNITKPTITYCSGTLNNTQSINVVQKNLQIIKTEPETEPEGSQNVYNHLTDIDMTKIKTEDASLDGFAKDIIKVEDPMDNEEYRISLIEDPHIEIKEENIKQEIDEQEDDVYNTMESENVDTSSWNDSNVSGSYQDLKKREESFDSSPISQDIESDGSEEEKQFGGPSYEPQRLGRIVRLLLRDDAPPSAAATAAPSEPTEEQRPQHLFHFEWRDLTLSRTLQTDSNSQLIKNESPASRQELLQVPPQKSNAKISPLTAFTNIWDMNFLQQVATWTNLRADRVLVRCRRELSNRSYIKCNWRRPTTAAEIRVYFAILMAMGMCPKKNLKSYFRGRDFAITDTPNFGKYMSYNKFCLFSRFLSFSDGDKKTGMTKEEVQYARHEKLLNHLNEKFQGLHEMDNSLVIDQYLLSGYPECEYSPTATYWSEKPNVNIESYAVCEADTGYVYRFHVSIKKGAKKDDESSDTDISTGSYAIVLNLLSGLKHKGYSVYMGSDVCSPALARALKCEGFDCVGVLLRSRESLPPQLTWLRAGDLERGAVLGWTSGDLDVIAWSECGRLLCMLSTYHGTQLGIRKLGQTKPLVFLDYSTCMEAMDRTDLSLATYSIQRHQSSIYKRLFRRLLNISVQNAYVMYKKSSGHLNHHDFREALIDEILDCSVGVL